LEAPAFWIRDGKWTLCQISHFSSMLCLCAYISDDNSKLLLRLKKHETSVNVVEDENSDSLITEFISDFMLPTRFLGD
jgi:DTW domain-containing protein YfiP